MGAYNNLVISAPGYNNTGLERATGLSFSTCYPGGLYTQCAFFVPRDVTIPWSVPANAEIIVTNGLVEVWRGNITEPAISVTAGETGIRVTAIGAWGNYLMTRTIDKPWADKRVDQNTWVASTGVTGAEKCTIDRQNRIRFTPKAVAWTSGDTAAVTYTAPTGQTIKRVAGTINMREAAQAWEINLYNQTSAASVQAWTSDQTNTAFDQTLATPATAVSIFWIARANQTGASDGTIYGQVSNVTVWTETGAIDLTEIATDIAGYVTELSTTLTGIGSNTLSLVPFVSDRDTYANNLTNAAAFGDSSYNQWAALVRGVGADGKPMLVVEQYPALTDWDYTINLTGSNVVSDIDIAPDINAVRNWISVQYQTDDGRPLKATPDDDANLMDTASIAAYGRRDEIITVDTTVAATAKNHARRLLAARKDPQHRVSSGITVQGYIDGRGGPVPASQIEAGKRIRIANILGGGLIMLITQTDYDDASETTAITIGESDNFAVFQARENRRLEIERAKK